MQSLVVVGIGHARATAILEETKRDGRRLLRLVPRPGLWDRVKLRRQRNGYICQAVRITTPDGSVRHTYCLIAFWRSDRQVEASFNQDIVPEMVPPGSAIEVVRTEFVPYSALDLLPDNRTEMMKRATCDLDLWDHNS